MVRLERHITVPVSPEEAYDYVADFSTSAEWDPGIRSAIQIEGDGIGVGAKYELVAEFMGRPSTLVYETLEADRPGRFVIVGKNARFKGLDVITFAPEGEGTGITYVAEFTMKGLLRFAEPFLSGAFNKLADKALAGMEASLSR